MSGKIQKVPPGLLSFLGIVGDGQTPSNLGSLVHPTVDLSPFYLARDLDSEGAPAAGQGAVGDSVSVTVPAGECWRMLGCGFIGSNMSVAVMTITAQLRMRTPNDDAIGLHPDWFVFTTSSTNDVINNGVWFPEPFLAMPGTLFESMLPIAATGGTFTMNVRPLFQRLRV